MPFVQAVLCPVLLLEKLIIMQLGQCPGSFPLTVLYEPKLNPKWSTFIFTAVVPGQEMVVQHWIREIHHLMAHSLRRSAYPDVARVDIPSLITENSVELLEKFIVVCHHGCPCLAWPVLLILRDIHSSLASIFFPAPNLCLQHVQEECGFGVPPMRPQFVCRRTSGPSKMEYPHPLVPSA